MRINSENKSMDMEVRDINYILPAYVRSYQFYSKNEVPTKIIFPMFTSIRAAGIDIPIEWVPPLDAVAVEISKDGENVAEVTPEQETVLDEKDEEIKKLKAEIEEMKPKPEETIVEELPAVTTPAPEDLIRQQEEAEIPDEEQTYEAAKADQPESPAKAAFAQPDRQPRQPPGGDIGPGQPLSDMHSRDRRDQVQTAKDLADEPSIDDTPEKPFEKEIKRDEQGRPIVEEKKED